MLIADVEVDTNFNTDITKKINAMLMKSSRRTTWTCGWSFSKGLTNLSTLLTKFDDHKFHQIRQYVDATVTKMHKD